MYNKVSLIGHLGKDPEVRHLESGATVARFSMATNENYRDKSGNWQTLTEWHDIVAWRNLAERVERDLKKGSLVFVEGKLTTRKWQDREGNDRYTTEVVAALIRPLDKRETQDSGLSSGMASAPDFNPPVQKVNSPQKQSHETDDIDDDLPF